MVRGPIVIKVFQQISRRLKIETYWKMKLNGRRNSPGEDCHDCQLIFYVLELAGTGNRIY